MISDKDIEKASEGENPGIEGLAASEEPPFRDDAPPDCR